MLGVQWLGSSSGEHIQGVPFAMGQSRSLEDQRNSLVQKQPTGSFPSEVGIGLSKIPGCLLRAIKNLRKKRSGGRGAPAWAGAAGCDSQQPGPAPFSSCPGHQLQLGCPGLLLVPLTFPGHRDELELLHRHNPWICAHSQGPNPPATPGLASRKMGKAEVRLCWINAAWKRNFPEPWDRGGTLCPRLGLGTPWRHIPQTFPVSMQHNPVTKTGFSGENMDINTDLNVGSPSGSTGSAQCPPD